ncbi:hypothetical protein [Lacipirellula parvula]|uniref:Core-binding (CB) domain-containing protein n=1 Tax=Lacipirellula parvula TaxID=2650471 RepID=A0A5K7XBM2_9BACT|nr:hypothetical protein [Lacipirellula parvula]BBO34200.1 hypothetical protein PLANPX_3812 [Lacipirellula parvula]
MAKAKPQKPYAAYPLYAHSRGSWAARIGGKVRYFGPWRDPKAALDKYLAYMNGSTVVDRKTVGSLTDAFLADKQAQLATGDITPVTFAEYKRTCEVIEAHYGRGRSADSLEFNSLRIALAKGKKIKTLGPVTLKRRLVIARMIFPNAGKPLKSPAQRVLRAAKEAAGVRLYEAADLRKLVATADDSFKWILLLGINCAFGPKDCSLFPGPDGEWHNFARPKTGISRRCWLWPETVEALKHQSVGWNRHNVAHTFVDLCGQCEVTNHGFYSLRRTFVTVAEGSQAVIDRICGWSRNDMATQYRQKTFDDKLRACSEGVRAWYLA